MNLALTPKQLGSQIDQCVTDALDKTKSAIDSYIDAGELLISAKGSCDSFTDWLDINCKVDKAQANFYIRIATHKVQARSIVAESGTVSVRDLQPLLPKTADAPIETEADASTLGYVGTQPGAKPRNADDWHTPKKYTDMAIDVMGGIDLDPFSSVQANQSICAINIFTEADNALDREWSDPKTRTCWMNPPYSKGLSGKAVDKFLEQYDVGAFDQAIVLMNSSTDTNWFDRMLGAATAVCFTRGRISFEDAGGKKASGNTKGQVFFYYGKNSDKFHEVFGEIGNVLNTGTV